MLRSWVILLGFLVAVGAPGVHAETCTCAAETFEWTGLGTTIPPASWDGCTPSADDDFQPGTGCVATISGGSVVDLGSGTGAIHLADDSRLEIEAAGELVISDAGITLADTATLSIQGRALETGSTPGFDAVDLTSLTRVDLGEYIPCPGDDNLGGLPVEDCDAVEADPGSMAEAAICWPDARFDNAPGSTSNFAGYTAQVQPGDVAIFWDYQGGFAPSRDVNAMYEVVDVQYASHGHRCLVLNVEQGDKDQVWTSGAGRGYPLSYRRVKPVSIRGAHAAGERVIDVDQTDVNDGDLADPSPDFNARWLTCRGPTGWCEEAPGTSCSSDPECSASCVRELNQHAKIGATFDDPAGDQIRLLPGGLDVALPNGEECYIDYGWDPGDSMAVFRPGRISVPDGQFDAVLESEDGTETVDFDFAVLDQLDELDLNATTSMHYVWIRDIAAGNAALEIAGLATLHGFQMTGGPLNCAVHGCHHSILIDAASDGDVDGTVIEDCNLRHSGDDFIVLSADSGASGGSIESLLVRRCRFAYADGRGASDNLVDQGTGTSSVRSMVLRDFLAEDAAGNVSNAFVGSSPGSISVRDGAFIAQNGGPFASAPPVQPWAFRNLFDAQHWIPGSSGGSFLARANGGFREMTFRDTVFEDGGSAGFVNLDSQGHSDIDRLLIVEPSMGTAYLVVRHADLLSRDQHWSDVAIVNPHTNNLTRPDRSVVWTRGSAGEIFDITLDRWTVIWDPNNPTDFLGGIQVNGNNATYDLFRHYQGFVIAGHSGLGGVLGAVSGTGEDYNSISGLCLQDNEADAEAPAWLPLDTLQDPGLVYASASRGDYRLAPTSPGFGSCGARNAGVRPDNWALRVLHYDAVSHGDSWRSPGFPGGGAWCGDLDADDLVAAADVQRLREHLAGQTPLSVAESLRCDVIAEQRDPSLDPDPADLAGGCSAADAAVLLRQLAFQGPSAGAVCAAGSHSACCAPNATNGCGHPETVECVCSAMPACCNVGWDATCAALACTGACADVCGDAVIGPTEDCEDDSDCDAGDSCDASCSCTFDFIAP